MPPPRVPDLLLIAGRNTRLRALQEAAPTVGALRTCDKGQKGGGRSLVKR